jgi:hypothetical protein
MAPSAVVSTPAVVPAAAAAATPAPVPDSGSIVDRMQAMIQKARSSTATNVVTPGIHTSALTWGDTSPPGQSAKK